MQEQCTVPVAQMLYTAFFAAVWFHFGQNNKCWDIANIGKYSVADMYNKCNFKCYNR